MARPPRFVAIQQPHLLAQSALDGMFLCQENDDFVNFLALLKNSAKISKVAIHGYALLPRSVMIIATPYAADSLSGLMQWIGRRYVPYFNRKYGRAGALWGARFRAAVVEAPDHFLPACQYVEESPVREGLASNAGEYPWSSFRAHAGREHNGLLTDHQAYWALGNTPFDREAAYQRRLEQALPASERQLIESALRGGWVIGSAAFAESLQKDAGRRLLPGKRGRPPSQGASNAPKN